MRSSSSSILAQVEEEDPTFLCPNMLRILIRLFLLLLLFQRHHRLALFTNRLVWWDCFGVALDVIWDVFSLALQDDDDESRQHAVHKSSCSLSRAQHIVIILSVRSCIPTTGPSSFCCWHYYYNVFTLPNESQLHFN